MLIDLAVYRFMNLGTFLTVEAIERHINTDNVRAFAGLGKQLPFLAAMLALCLWALAGFPPFGSFVGKAMLFEAIPVSG